MIARMVCFLLVAATTSYPKFMWKTLCECSLQAPFCLDEFCVHTSIHIDVLHCARDTIRERGDILRWKSMILPFTQICSVFPDQFALSRYFVFSFEIGWVQDRARTIPFERIQKLLVNQCSLKQSKLLSGAVINREEPE